MAQIISIGKVSAAEVAKALGQLSAGDAIFITVDSAGGSIPSSASNEIDKMSFSLQSLQKSIPPAKSKYHK